MKRKMAIVRLCLNTTACLLAAATLCGGAAAEVRDQRSPRGTTAIRIALDINRNLLKKLTAEYEDLHAAQVRQFSEKNERRMHDIEIEIITLNGDAMRLQHSLAQCIQAEEMLKVLISRNIDRLRAEALPSAPEAQRDRLYAMHEKALRSVEHGDPDAAARTYEDIILLNPDDDEAYLIMGHVYLMSGNYEKAEFAFHNAVNIDPRNLSEIIPFYQNRVMKDPSDDAAYADLGYAWLIMGDFLKAKDAFRDCLRVNPANDAALKGLRLTEAH